MSGSRATTELQEGSMGTPKYGESKKTKSKQEASMGVPKYGISADKGSTIDKIRERNKTTKDAIDAE